MRHPLTLAVVGIVSSVLLTAPVTADDWPEWRGQGRLGIWNESDIIEQFPPQGLMVTWRTPVRTGFAGPAVANGRVFVLDYQETPGSRTMDGTERLLCLDETSGAVIWTHEWPTTYRNILGSFATGPRATPTVSGDQVYVMGAGGILVALNTRTGTVAWQVDTVADYDATVPVYGTSSAPLATGNLVVAMVGGQPDALVVAFNQATGDEVWRALPSQSETGYSQPVIVEAGGTQQLIVWHAVGLTSLNPLTGAVHWNQDWFIGGGMAITTPVQSGRYLLVSHFFNGSMMMALNPDRPTARLLWQGQNRGELPDQTDGLHSIISTPLILEDHIYGIGSYGELRGLDARTGERLWHSEALTPQERWATAFFVRHPQRNQFFVTTEEGDLVIAKLSPTGYIEIDRTPLITPTSRTRGGATRRWGDRLVHWSHPAFANRHVVVRNDREIIRVSLDARDYSSVER